MTIEQYKQKVKDLQAEFEAKKRVLSRQYALANNPYKVGDIFTDHIGSIRIEKIQITTGNFEGIPSCVYAGVELKKDGTPNKKGNKRVAHQVNDINKK